MIENPENLYGKLKESRAFIKSGLLCDMVPDAVINFPCILDEYFRYNFEQSMVGPSIGIVKNPYAVIAIGGYGRQEWSTLPNVDLMFLFKEKVPEGAAGLIKEMVYPLWDLGLKVNYSTLSINESINLAVKEPDLMTSVFDARFVCGASPLFSELNLAVRSKILLNKTGKIISWLIDRDRKRHESYGNTVWQYEPDIMESPGGLMDFRTMYWLGRLKFNLSDLSDFKYFGYLSNDEFEEFAGAIEFIRRIKTILHNKSNGGKSVVSRGDMRVLGRDLNMEDSKTASCTEHFSEFLYSKMKIVKNRYDLFTLECKPREKGRRSKEKRVSVEKVKGIELSKGMINISSTLIVTKYPVILMRAFYESLKYKLPLSSEAERIVKEFCFLVDEKFRDNSESSLLFDKILSGSIFCVNVLESMLRTGFLESYIPEFRGVADLVEHDNFHIYPVDSHLVKTVEILKSVPEKKGSFISELYKGINRKNDLVYAAFLHDIGKGVSLIGHESSGYDLSGTILKRLGKSQKSTSIISSLIDNHEVIISMLDKRVVNDTGILKKAALKIKTKEFLDMLFVLSVSDIKATGKSSWDDYQSAVSEKIYYSLLSVIEGSDENDAKSFRKSEENAEAIINIHGKRQGNIDLIPLLSAMTGRYLNENVAENILSHISLIQKIDIGQSIISVAADNDPDQRVLTVCGRHKPELMQMTLSVLSRSEIIIRDLKSYKWKNGITVDIYSVKTPAEKIFEEDFWERIEHDINNSSCIMPTEKKASGFYKTEIINDESSHYTIIEFQVEKNYFSMANVSVALNKLRTDIFLAKISYKGLQCFASVYVLDYDGRKLTESVYYTEKITTLLNSKNNDDIV